MTLKDFFDKHTTAALAFSGGVDSSYLLYAAHKLGANVHPYFIKSEFQPQFELDDAIRFCENLGVTLKIIYCDILCRPEIASNTIDRCYHCKTALFAMLWKRVAQDGHTVLFDGTNASDNPRERPGMRALRELSVLSPLRECGLTKADILRLSYEVGLPEKESYSCLATRIPQGRMITAELLLRVERAENALFALGYTGFRVRVQGDSAKLEMKAGQISTAFECRDEIISRLSPYFDTVSIDLRSR